MANDNSDWDVSGWPTARQAIIILDVVFPDPGFSTSELIERLRGGMVRACAAYTTIDGQRQKAGTINQISPKDWEMVGPNNDVWVTGTLTVEHTLRSYERASVFRFFDTRFCPDDIKLIVAPHQDLKGKTSDLAKRSPSETMLPNKGGRPSKSFWQDFWVEMCRRVHAGDIHPTSTQADILKQMQQWVSDHDHEAGDTVLKDAAQKLARALKS